MRVLVLSHYGAGNWPPERALIAALVDRNHDVHVISDLIHEDDTTQAGATFVPYRYAKNRSLDSDADPTPEYLIKQVLLNRDHLTELLDATARTSPDLILVDHMLWSTIAGAEQLDQPSVVLWHTIYGGRPFFRQTPRPMLEALNAQRSELGLPPVANVVEQAERADGILAFTYEQFDVVPNPRPPNLQYVGPLGCLARTGAVTPYALPWANAADRPLVLVSFSTSFMDQLGALQRVADALGSLKVRALITVGPAIDKSRLRLPDNVRAESFVPHEHVLRDAKLVITHAGHGTTMAAVTAGVPLLCMPMGRDQFDVTARVVANNLGREIPHESSAEELARAIEGVLSDSGLAETCRRFSEGINLEDGLMKAISVVQQLGQA